VCETLPVHIRDHEPRQALDGGADGLGVIRMVVQDGSFALKAGGGIFLEIGYDQGPATRSLLEETGYQDVEIHPDLSGKDRMVVGWWLGE